MSQICIDGTLSRVDHIQGRGVVRVRLSQRSVQLALRRVDLRLGRGVVRIALGHRRIQLALRRINLPLRCRDIGSRLGLSRGQPFLGCT